MGRLLHPTGVPSRPPAQAATRPPLPPHPSPSWIAAYGLSVLAAIAIVAIGSLEIALGYQVACRLVSVLYLAVALRRELRRPDREGAESRFARFSRIAAFNINNDAVAMVALCLATPGTLPLATGPWVAGAAGGALVILGVAFKLWAARSLGFRNYYCRDFFLPPERRVACRKGPYRFLRNPMYTVGYAQAYGLALALASWPGLAAAAFAQAAMLAFWVLVERPHVRRLYVN